MHAILSLLLLAVLSVGQVAAAAPHEHDHPGTLHSRTLLGVWTPDIEAIARASDVKHSSEETRKRAIEMTRKALAGMRLEFTAHTIRFQFGKTRQEGTYRIVSHKDGVHTLSVTLNGKTETTTVTAVGERLNFATPGGRPLWFVRAPAGHEHGEDGHGHAKGEHPPPPAGAAKPLVGKWRVHSDTFEKDPEILALPPERKAAALEMARKTTALMGFEFTAKGEVIMTMGAARQVRRFEVTRVDGAVLTVETTAGDGKDTRHEVLTAQPIGDRLQLDSKRRRMILTRVEQ